MADVNIDLNVLIKDAVRSIQNFSKSAAKQLGSVVTKTNELAGGFEKFGNKVNQSFGFLTEFNSGLQLIGSSFEALSGAFDIFIRQTADFETALVGVQKTTNFSVAETEAFGSAIRDLALDIPVATGELLAIAQSAGQLGVTGSDNIQNFTETIARLGFAANVSGEEAATSLARILNVSGESVDQIDELASVVVRLGNNFAATEAEIINVTNEIARGTGTFGVSSAEAAALATALRSLGVRAELAGGVTIRAFNEINNAINEGGSRLELLSQITGTAADQLRTAFDQDSIGVFQDFVEGLATVEQSRVNEFLDAFGLKGTEAAKVLPPLVKNTELFADALTQARDEVSNTSALLTESQQAFDTTNGSLQLLSNSFDELALTIGTSIAPAVKVVIDALIVFVNAVDGVIEVLGALANSFLLEPIFSAFANIAETLIIDPIFNIIEGIQNLQAIVEPAFSTLANFFGASDTALADTAKQTGDELEMAGQKGSEGAAKINKELETTNQTLSQTGQRVTNALGAFKNAGAAEAAIKNLNKELARVQGEVQKITDASDPIGALERRATAQQDILQRSLDAQLISEQTYANQVRIIRENLANEIDAINAEAAEKERQRLEELAQAEQKRLEDLGRELDSVQQKNQSFQDSVDPVGAIGRQAQNDLEIIKRSVDEGLLTKQQAADQELLIAQRTSDELQKIADEENEAQRKRNQEFVDAEQKKYDKITNIAVQSLEALGQLFDGFDRARDIGRQTDLRENELAADISGLEEQLADIRPTLITDLQPLVDEIKAIDAALESGIAGAGEAKELQSERENLLREAKRIEEAALRQEKRIEDEIFRLQQEKKETRQTGDEQQRVAEFEAQQRLGETIFKGAVATVGGVLAGPAGAVAGAAVADILTSDTFRDSFAKAVETPNINPIKGGNPVDGLFASGGEVPSGFPNDSFRAGLTSGENVIDRSLSEQLRGFLSLVEGLPSGIRSESQSFDSGRMDSMEMRLADESQRDQNVSVTLQVGEQELANVLLNLNRQGFKTA